MPRLVVVWGILISLLGCKAVLMAIRQESNLSCPLDGSGQLVLVLGAVAGLPPALDLALISNIALKDTHILVVYLFHSVYTESANAAARVIAALLPLASLFTLAFLSRCLPHFVPSDDLLCQL